MVNGEAYHPDDNAHDIIWHTTPEPPNHEECDKLNDLMNQIYELEDFDPCEILHDLFWKDNKEFLL